MSSSFIVRDKSYSRSNFSPLNIAEQNTINERDEIIPSKRLTYNQSMMYKFSNTSINSQVIKTNFRLLSVDMLFYA